MPMVPLPPPNQEHIEMEKHYSGGDKFPIDPESQAWFDAYDVPVTVTPRQVGNRIHTLNHKRHGGGNEDHSLINSCPCAHSALNILGWEPSPVEAEYNEMVAKMKDAERERHNAELAEFREWKRAKSGSSD